MGFLTRLLAGLTAAAALGTGLAGTANAVDVTGAAGTTKSVVKLTADDTNNLPDHIVNGSFDYPSVPSWTGLAGSGSNKFNKGKRFATINPGTGKYGSGCAMSTTGRAIPNWNRSSFAWSSTQGDTHYSGGMSCEAGNVELNYDSVHHNQFAELTADQQGTAIYQDVKVTPGTMMKWSLKHSSATSAYVDKMQVMIGEPYKETAQEATRITSENGNKVGEKMTTISTPTTSDRADNKKWDTYSGAYLVPDGVTTVRFTFKSVASAEWYSGNDLDDIEFSRSYKLTYDKNSADASGQVPSNQHGKENTTQPAESKATGNVKTVSDDAAGRTVLECRQSGEGATGPYADKFCWIDWSNLPLSRTGEPIPVRINVPGGHIDADATITHTDNAALTTKDFTGDKWSRLIPAYRLTGNTALAFHHIQGNSADPLASVMFSNITPVANQTATSVNVLKDFQLAFGDAETMSGYVVNDKKTYEQTDIESDKMLDKLGMIGDANPDKSYSEANTGYGTTHVTLAGGPAGKHAPFTDDSNSKGAAVIGATQPTRFKVSFKQVNHPVNNAWSAIAVGVYMPYLTAYPLNYDKNSSNATGEVPSNQRGGENTVQPAKAKTTGTVKTVADENVRYGSLANGDFSYPSFSDIQKNEQETPADLRTFLKSDDGTLWYNMSVTDLSKYGKIGQIPGFDSSRFAWSSTENGSRVELQQDRNTKNTYAEIVAQQDNTSIYQNVSTGNGGVLYKIRLKHASRQSSHADRMQVLVGSDMDHATPVEMTRVTSNGHGDKVGGKSTIITTKVSNTDPRDHGAQWETYEGYYQVPEGQKNTVFMFKSLEGFKEDETLPGNNIGNLVDDIEFSRSYKLTYDANSSDASGQVPSDTAANTVKQAKAKAKTTGTVRAVADRTASGLTVHDLKNGEIAPVQYGDFKFSTVNGFSADQVTNVNGFTVKTNWNPTVENQAYGGRSLDTMYQPNKNGANLILHHVGQWRDSSGTQRWLNAKITVNGQNLGSLVYYESQHKFLASYGKWDLHTSSRPYMDVTVDFLLDDGSTPQGLRGVTGFTDLDGGTSGYNEGVELVSGFDGAYVRSDAHLARFGTNGWAGVTDENENNADAHGMKHYVGATFTGSSFRVRWSVASGQARGSGFQPVDSTIAYRLTYDKNAQDATGSIPSDTAANTTRPAKSETDGKVSDLVQRTTTHEDGSVTVRTIDQSTDVVSGCQVYYPAGQRITLATLAKDDDCWDSSMLSRPGHTQLGWNQDRNATQAQAQVTMVEGGMTVYAVWVGNPVLTYDTNKPSTWSGQMPSTPASVSVPYNAPAADGSGWRAGDVSKIRGYRFLGWYSTPQDDAGLYDWNTLLTGSVTVYAHWQRLQANVIYDANGGTGSHANTTGWQYSDVTIPGDTSKSFTRDGYVFKGWSLKAGKADVVYKDGSQIPLQDKDITLYAQWQGIHENFTETGGISLPLLIAGGIGLLVMGVGSTVMLTRRMNGHGMPDGE
ncbi:InlB B-repeat-containing protein [Bifidobacterium adolescentis]|uniref:Cell surface protein n=1 Tax=Bifidobacterium adolescentis TaxID=1680 RepID=A0A173WK50_BIFAD|nr:InlB B-repeat-containing protein [Bifidobacterium adolescentis]CUN39939.1 cell surface protein [Bifidobacterium adolescentis]